MSDIHIEEFYHDIGHILAQLYNNFPRPIHVYVEDIAGPDAPDEYGLHSERHMSCFASMIWLQKQGYINFQDTIRQEAIDSATLTQTGFLILSEQSSITLDSEMENTVSGQKKQLPDYVLQDIISNINILREALKSRSSIRISKISRHILEKAKQ